jgi:Leucine-rich repeat (LRR) protein
MNKRQNESALPMAEMNVLKELEELFQASASLREGETIGVQLQDQMECHSHDLGVLIENHTVVALSARYCALTALPSSIGQLTNLRELDLTGNHLTALPETIVQLTNLETLHVYGNHLAGLPESLGPTVEGPGTGGVSINWHQLLGRRGQYPGSGARATWN